jgi:hypothetical protein
LDVSIGFGEQSNDVEIGSRLLEKRYYGGKGREGLHLEGVWLRLGRALIEMSV